MKSDAGQPATRQAGQLDLFIQRTAMANVLTPRDGSTPPMRRLAKYYRGRIALQYRILAKFAEDGFITTAELNRWGETNWDIQRSGGQRIRDCRNLFRLGIPEPFEGADCIQAFARAHLSQEERHRLYRTGVLLNGRVWIIESGSRGRARQLVAEADRGR